MSQLMTLQSAAAGQLLMRVGEPADRMLVLLRGSVTHPHPHPRANPNPHANPNPYPYPNLYPNPYPYR